MSHVCFQSFLYIFFYPQLARQGKIGTLWSWWRWGCQMGNFRFDVGAFGVWEKVTASIGGRPFLDPICLRKVRQMRGAFVYEKQASKWMHAGGGWKQMSKKKSLPFSLGSPWSCLSLSLWLGGFIFCLKKYAWADVTWCMNGKQAISRLSQKLLYSSPS
jgi:hypothetical protein